MKGLDTTEDMFPQGGNLKSDGIGFVGRYLNGSASKTALTQKEASHLSALGIKLLSIFERNPVSVGYFTYEKGLEDGKLALKYAQASGQPAGGVVFFTVDYDASKSHFDEVQAYFKGVRQTLMPAYVPGVYGSGAVCKACWDAGLVRATWLAQSWGWAGYGDWFPKCQVAQGADSTWREIDVDFDVCFDVSVLW